MTDKNDEEKLGPVRKYTRHLGKSAGALAIPYILIGYPLTGLFLGWFIVKTFNAPSWVQPVLICMALIQAFREVYKIAVRCEDNDSVE